jgi:hypothetical protein
VTSFEYFLLERGYAGTRSKEAYLSGARNLVAKSAAFNEFTERMRKYYSRELGEFFDAIKENTPAVH